MTLASALAQSAPVGGKLVSGAGSIAQTGGNTTVTQTSQNLSLNWTSFNLAAQESVNFVQPSVSAVAVNRIADSNGSQILGRINANGQVFLINPNGILFGPGAQVNVGGLVASTLDLSDASLGNSARTFSGDGLGSIVNQGTIRAAANGAEGGYVALLGRSVSNQGTIDAPLGAVSLGAGSAVTLNFSGNSLVGMQIERSLVDSLAENGGLIHADGGVVTLSAGARDSLLASVVNNTGLVQARTVENQTGRIVLLGGMAAGSVHVGGTLDASAPQGGDGGFIDTSAAHVKVAEGATITTLAAPHPGGVSGTWLIDPVNFTIDTGMSSDMSGATLSSALASGNVSIQSASGSTAQGDGDVNVNQAVSWSANRLTLTAAHAVNINAVMTVAGTAGLSLNTSTANGADAAMAGGAVNLGLSPDGSFGGRVDFDRVGSGFLTINGSNFTVINSLGSAASVTALDLQGMRGDLAANYALGGNIDAAATVAWNSGAGFVPVGSMAAKFTGSFNGLGHTVAGLTINAAAQADVGLIGAAGGHGSIGNVGLVGGSVRGAAGTGGLIGNNEGADVNNSFNTGSVSGAAGTGGLVGNNLTGNISRSHSTGPVTGAAGTGGVLGSNVSGGISDSYSTGDVTGAAGSGGLMGSNTTGSVSDSYATGNVTGAAGTGGLMGAATSGDVSNSYALGHVQGAAGTGGLAGAMTSGSVVGSYATGNVVGAAGTGGLVGANTSGSISNSYALGNVQGAAGTGGLTGATAGTVSGSFATGNVVGAAGAGGLIGASTGNVNSSYATGNAVGDSSVGALVGASSGVITASYAAGVATNTAGAVVGEPSSLSVAQVQEIMRQNLPAGIWGTSEAGTPILLALVKTFTVKAQANDVSKSYDGLAYTGGSGATYATSAGDGDSNGDGRISTDYAQYGFTGTLHYGGSAIDQKNVGSYAIALSGLSSPNKQYLIAYVDGKLTITPALVSAVASRAYDGSTAVAGSLFTLSGLQQGETLGLSGSGRIASKNVGGPDLSVSPDSLALVNGSGLASNYTLIGGDLSAAITPRALTATVTAPDRAYNGLRDATPRLIINPAGLVAGENLTVTATGSFNSKDVVGANTVTVTTTTLADGLNGLARNYSLAAGGQATAYITPAILHALATRSYDGTTTVASNMFTLRGLQGGESLTLGGTGSVADKNIGIDKTVGMVGLLLGNGSGLASNYTLAGGDLSADITPRLLTVTAVGRNKVYSGNTAAGATLYDDRVAGDTLGLIGTSSFSDKNVGTGKTIQVSGIGITGLDAANYSLSSSTYTTSGAITAKALVVTALGTNRVYDGSINDAVKLSSTGIVAGDVVSLASSSAVFANKNVGVAKAVAVSGISLAGADAGNYSVNTTANTVATVTAKPISVAATGLNKVFNGNLNALVALFSSGVVAGDGVTFGSNQPTFASSTVGLAKAVTVTGIKTTGGIDAGNYTLTNVTATTTANITK